jgi:integrase
MGRAGKRETLTERRIAKYPPPASGYYLVYDEPVPRLAVAVYSSGAKSLKFIYTLRGRTKWVTIGSARDVAISAARAKAHRLSAMIADNRDPQSEHMEAKRAESFALLVERYYTEYAEANLKSHAQGRYLLSKYVPDKINRMRARDVTKADVKGVLLPLQAKTPSIARQVLPAISAVFKWAVEEADVLSANPCRDIKLADGKARERVLSAEELPEFWARFGKIGATGIALRVLLLLGQRPGEIAAMHREHIDREGWWHMPGLPKGKWPGTKNARNHSVWLPKAVLELIGSGVGFPTPDGLAFGGQPAKTARAMRAAMAKICSELGVEQATPHDLRRTHGSCITRLLGFGGRSALNRIQNHIEGGIATVYDRYGYSEETKRVMDQVAAELMRIAERRADAMVVALVKSSP